MKLCGILGHDCGCPPSSCCGLVVKEVGNALILVADFDVHAWTLLQDDIYKFVSLTFSLQMLFCENMFYLSQVLDDERVSRFI